MCCSTPGDVLQFARPLLCSHMFFEEVPASVESKLSSVSGVLQMLLQALSRVGVIGRQVLQHAHRNIGLSAVAAQKAATVSDPIQQLFLDKVREYKTK